MELKSSLVPLLDIISDKLLIVGTMVTPVKKVPIHLQSAQNRLIIKNGTVVNCDKEEQVDIYIEVSQEK